MQLVEDAMSQIATAKVQMMTSVRLPMVHTVGCKMAIGSCYSVRRSSATGRCGTAILRLVVFNCRSAVAVLAWGSHVVGYVHAPMDICVILDRCPRRFGAGYRRGIVDSNMLLFHVRETKAVTVGGISTREGTGLLLMVLV